MNTKEVYDDYEISGCHRLDDAGLPNPNGLSIETCDDADAQFWTLYGHIDGQGVEAIGDFNSREAAEKVFCRITGESFTGSYEVNPRLRLMHAAPALLASLKAILPYAENEHTSLFSCWNRNRDSSSEAEARSCGRAIDQATAAIAATEAAAVFSDPDIHALLAAQRQIAIIWCVEDVQENRPDLSDEQAWEVLQSVRHGHDATIGINWDVLDCHAEMLFGHLPGSNQGEEA